VPIFAHPERIRYFQDDVSRYESVVRLGAYGQITTGSITGRFGSTVEEFSEELLRKRLVHVLASDAHNIRGRPPVLGHALDVMVPMVGEEVALAMANEFPAALLRGEEIELPAGGQPPVRRRGFFARLFGNDESA
jgi:protein-tyrosine phosphatase